MTQVLSHEPHLKTEPHPRARIGEDAVALLRDIAFVLTMTQKVRRQIDAKERGKAVAQA